MKDFTLRDLLRYGLPGGMLILSAILVHFNGLPNVDLIKDLGEAALVLAASVLAGSIVYTTHRAIIYPFIYRLVARRVVKHSCREKQKPAFCVIYPSESEFLWDLARWEARTSIGPAPPAAQLGDWADQIHFLYTASLATVLGVALAAVLSPCVGACELKSTALALLILAILLACVAVFTHARYLYVEFRLLKMADKLPTTEEKTQSVGKAATAETSQGGA